MRKWKKLACRLAEMEDRLAQRIIAVQSAEEASYRIHQHALSKIRDLFSKKGLAAFQPTEQPESQVSTALLTQTIIQGEKIAALEKRLARLEIPAARADSMKYAEHLAKTARAQIPEKEE